MMSLSHVAASTGCRITHLSQNYKLKFQFLDNAALKYTFNVFYDIQTSPLRVMLMCLVRFNKNSSSSMSVEAPRSQTDLKSPIYVLLRAEIFTARLKMLA